MCKVTLAIAVIFAMSPTALADEHWYPTVGEHGTWAFEDM